MDLWKTIFLYNPVVLRGFQVPWFHFSGVVVFSTGDFDLKTSELRQRRQRLAAESRGLSRRLASSEDSLRWGPGRFFRGP